jgi:ankyrin repeat protein
MQSLDAVDWDGRAALHVAAGTGNEAAALLLLVTHPQIRICHAVYLRLFC